MIRNKKISFVYRGFFLSLASVFIATVFSVSLRAEVVDYQYEILETVSHDPSTFTQGLVINNEWLYESSGHYGKSYLQKINLNTNKIVDRLKLPSDVFAEGLTIFNEHLYLLSWKQGKAWVIKPDSFELVKTFNYSGEGWGLSHNKEFLIVSDGSHVIRLFDANSFELKGTLTVKENGTLVKSLNELEYVDGIIWANIWRQSRIVGIDINTGDVVASLDLSKLQRQSGSNTTDSVLNGIAYDASKNAFWVTGKYWKDRYLIKITK